MSGIRTYVVGRDRECDVRLDDPSVSRRHAECVRLANGRLHVTDCATMNGTFVLDDEEWRAVRQTLVEPSDHIRFGDCRMTAARLAALCPRDDAGTAGGKSAGSGRGAIEELDASRGLVRDRETGELFEKEPPQRRGRRIKR